MNAKRLILLMGILTCLILQGSSHGFWLDTHKKITDKAAGSANLNSILESQTGITNGMGLEITVFSKTKTLQEWLEFGSQEEDGDIGSLRYFNHFYNPLNESGLYGTFLSSYKWADDDRNEERWYVARSAFYRALIAWSDNDRKTALANCFRALGQVTHLVQDLAVPAHTRNDGHNPDGFEKYVDEHIGGLNLSNYAFAKSLVSVSPSAPKQFWDSGNYRNSKTPTINNTQGLAEYSNANFASDDSVFSENNLNDWWPLNDGYYAPHPAKSEAEYYEEYLYTTMTLGVPMEVRRGYYRKNGTEPIEHFAYTGRLQRAIGSRPIPTETAFLLDDKCHKDYASLLLPRAVGYSAGILNYFFRGEIDLKPDSANRDKFVILNKGSELMFGTFSLYYDYDEGDAKDNRKVIASWYKTISAGNQSEPVTFSMPSSPAPKEKCKFILVFQGTIGNEVGAVVGKKVAFCEGNTGTITGPDKVFTGKNTSYTLNWPDAIGNITWSTDNPSANIWGDNNGATLWAASGACSSNKGAITITATDICGNKTELTVQTGTWVLVSSQGVKYSYACETISGSFKTEYWWKACCDVNGNNGAGCLAECGGNPIGGIPPCGSEQTVTCPLPCGTNCSWCYNTFGVFNYEWRCQ